MSSSLQTPASTSASSHPPAPSAQAPPQAHASNPEVTKYICHFEIASITKGLKIVWVGLMRSTLVERIGALYGSKTRIELDGYLDVPIDTSWTVTGDSLANKFFSVASRSQEQVAHFEGLLKALNRRYIGNINFHEAIREHFSAKDEEEREDRKTRKFAETLAKLDATTNAKELVVPTAEKDIAGGTFITADPGDDLRRVAQYINLDLF